MPTDPVATVSRTYDAFARSDAPLLTTLLADTEWHEADGMPYGGTYRGAAAIFQNVFGPIAADVEKFSARPDELLAIDGGRVLAIGRYRGTARNGPLDVGFAHLWTVHDDTIARFVQYADTHRFREAVGR